MSRQDPETTLRQALRFGRMCKCCHQDTKKWSRIKQVRCDICESGGTILKKKSDARERYLNGK